MKKKLNLENLSLNKDVISNLDQFKGGESWTGGCSDGCTGSTTFSSSWNCTKDTCTDDCEGRDSSCVCTTKDGIPISSDQENWLLHWNAEDPTNHRL